MPSEFAYSIEGSRGTIVFGNGVRAVTGDIVKAHDDHVEVEVPRSHPAGTHDIVFVPVAAIAYYRFADDD